jgi:4-amino-4-deoxy-L-arabinose transferase-like glycosyltransferase
MFPVFRAHPLLFQTLLSLVLRLQDTDWTARAFAAGIGVATVALTYLLASRLYGRKAGMFAALLLAVMPYHVIVSRQVLLDGLMTLCATAALYCIVRYVESVSLSWLLATGAMMGVTILSKETSVVLLGSMYAFFVLTPTIRTRIHHILLALLAMVALVAVYPLALRASGHSKTGQSYLLWQLFRRPNHGTLFYFTTLPSWIGAAALILAISGLFWLRREATWRERLLLAWILVPVLFFTVWPVKGFEYLLPIAPPVAVLAGRTLAQPLIFFRPGWLSGARWLSRIARTLHISRRWAPRAAMAMLAAASVVSMGLSTWNRIEPSTSASFLAGTGGVSGGRQAGDWVQRHVPAQARLLAIGPSMANILEFYGTRRVSALSVSPNPHNRNPVYIPVPNPDRAVRAGEFQYIVWDAYTAARSPFFAGQASRLAQKFHGVAVFTATETVRSPSGANVVEPVIVIYQVRTS